MAKSPHTIGIVVDPAFGERLNAFAARGPVSIADTPVNRAAAEQMWAGQSPGGDTDPGGVTTFQVDPAAAPETWVVAILGVVDEHHGASSQLRPYGALEVVGARPTTALRAALAAHSLTEVTILPTGFRASRRPAP